MPVVPAHRTERKSRYHFSLNKKLKRNCQSWRSPFKFLKTTQFQIKCKIQPLLGNFMIETPLNGIIEKRIIRQQHTISSRFAVFRSEVDSASHSTPTVRHDPKSTLQNGCNHRYIGSVPKKFSVCNLIVFCKPFSLL